LPIRAQEAIRALLISLRKHIDEYRAGHDTAGGLLKSGESGIAEEAVAEFRAMLLAIGRCGERAVPGSGADLHQKMTDLHGALVKPVAPGAVSQTNQQAQAELSEWAERAHSHHQDVEREVHEIISVISAAAASVGERDARYANQLGELTGRLGSIAQGNDLAHMRRSIVESTRALKACVAHMTEESKTLVSSLSAEVKEYRARFEEAERISNTDPLTDLFNRRAFEKDLERRIGEKKPFSLISIDLDGFKGVNDKFGHPAGDDLLRQFAMELREQFSMGDLVARLGGDEFVVVTHGNYEDALAKVERIQKWVMGEYKIRHRDRVSRIAVSGSIGVGEWNREESAASLVARVDEEVYRAKKPRERRVGRAGA
jgi:diguanylate cyclase (GGDEF)-like protein